MSALRAPIGQDKTIIDAANTINERRAVACERTATYWANKVKGLQANVEACRAITAMAKASQTFQQGLLTLQRMRSGGKQQVSVVHQHVQVNDASTVAIAPLAI